VAITELSLPVDIPWKRMGVSKDMIDETRDDLEFPDKWRSSIAVFYHEATDLPPDYCGRKVTYLKVVCTVASYQVEGEDVTVLDELAKQYEEFYAWKEFDSRLTQAFPCYSALLQVSVFPKPGTNVPLHDYPYISAFQPRKREMYEVVTESGEMTSQSGNKLNVLKGATNTETTEDYDLDLGGGGGGSGGLFGLWSEQHTDPNKQVGTINRSQTENQNVTTQDTSREKRESHAFSTNINQLYTLLQGFHLGTNRAIFLVDSRPHMQDQKFGFVRGLRRLEGIQEFFLIVNRPESVPGLCVEIALETAHAYLERAYEPRLIRLSELYAPGNLAKTAAALAIDTSVSNWPAHWAETLVDTWYIATALDRLYAGLWPNLTPELASHSIPNEIGKLLMVVKQVPDIGIEDIALIFEEYESDSGYFFVIGRKLCACFTPATPHESEEGAVSCEESVEDHVSSCDDPRRKAVVVQKRYLGRAGMPGKSPKNATRALHLNEMMRDMKEMMTSSVGSTTRRAYGETSFLETEFALEELAQLVRLLGKAGVSSARLVDTPRLQPFVSRGLGRGAKARTVTDLGDMTTTDVGRELAVPAAEAAQARREILVAALHSLDPKSARADAVPENPIRERFRVAYPPDRLKQLEDSARGKRTRSPAKPTRPR
jgi:hypothetical protein